MAVEMKYRLLAAPPTIRVFRIYTYNIPRHRLRRRRRRPRTPVGRVTRANTHRTRRVHITYTTRAALRTYYTAMHNSRPSSTYYNGIFLRTSATARPLARLIQYA